MKSLFTRGHVIKGFLDSNHIPRTTLKLSMKSKYANLSKRKTILSLVILYTRPKLYSSWLLTGYRGIGSIGSVWLSINSLYTCIVRGFRIVIFLKDFLGPFYIQWIGTRFVKRKKWKLESQILVLLKGKGKIDVCKGERKQKWRFIEDKRKFPKDQKERCIWEMKEVST